MDQHGLKAQGQSRKENLCPDWRTQVIENTQTIILNSNLLLLTFHVEKLVV